VTERFNLTCLLTLRSYVREMTNFWTSNHFSIFEIFSEQLFNKSEVWKAADVKEAMMRAGAFQPLNAVLRAPLESALNLFMTRKSSTPHRALVSTAVMNGHFRRMEFVF
jgi:hypothetical protein